MAGLSPQITNLVIMLGMMQVSKRIPFDDPSVLNTVRLVYISSNVIIGLLYLYIQVQINKKKGAQYFLPLPLRAYQRVA
jgi:hypothetical protein